MAPTAASALAAVPDLSGRSVWVIDTLSRVYQLFHALPEMPSPQGIPVSAVYGFARDLLEVIEKKQPDYIFCAMDAPGPTFRHERFAAYKGTRAPMPADLVPQIPLVRRLLDVIGIPCLELAGFEADDILATLATCAAASGGHCILATSDKDARQLLSPQVQLLNLRTNTFYGASELLAEWGIRPDQVVDFLSLVGDAVDNVPGVPQIGPKSATELLRTYNTLDSVLEHADEVAGLKRRENLKTHADGVRASRELIRLVTNVPITIPWESGRRHAPDAARLAEFLREMGFKSLLAKVLVPAIKPPAPTTPQRPSAQGMLNFLDDCSDPVESPLPLPATVLKTTVECPANESELAKLLLLVASAAPLTLCTARQSSGSILSKPVGIALAAGDVCIWVSAELLGSKALKELLENPLVKKTGHDLKRQAVALRAIGIHLAGCALDTLVAAYLLDAGERNQSLSEVAKRYRLSTTEPAETSSVVAQSQQECRTVEQLCMRLPDLLREAGLLQLFHELEMPLVHVLAEMELRGMRIDCDILARLSAHYAQQLELLEREIHALAGHSFVITSPLQVRGVLFDELKLPVVKRIKTGPSTDAAVLEELAALHPLPAKLLEHRKYSKLKSTYVDALPMLVEAATGRIHTSFNQTTTATGRLSSSDPNLQNIPIRTAEGQQIRDAFLPREPGWRFVSADYSQIELRILAHLSHDAAMREAFFSGEDIHTRTAAAVFGCATTQVSAEMRRTAKAVNFGILYGQSAFGLAKALDLSQADAAAFIAAYFQAFSGAAAFMDDVLDRCRQDGHVTTILGRRRAIVGVRDREGRRSAGGGFALSLPERTAINTVVQGSAADLIKLAMLEVDRRLAAGGLQAGIVLQIHDELLLDCPAEETTAVEQLLPEAMRQAMHLDVPLEVSVLSGKTWAET